MYANVGAASRCAVYNRLESGFIGFDFHPEFARNGLFYTVHGERATGNPATPHFIPPGFTPADVTYHNVITEWHATNPAANTFEGTRRELLRVAHIVDNLTPPVRRTSSSTRRRSPARPTTACSTRAAATWGSATAADRTRTTPARRSASTRSSAPSCASTRAVPSVSGGTKGLGDYTIPPANKFAADGDPKTLGEIYAYGFRNAHRLSWDLTDGTMFASDIGMNHIEEINIVRNGEQLRLDEARGLLRERR